MQPARWLNIKDILSSTIELPEDQRKEFLSRVTDPEIRAEVEKLLAAHEKAEDFIDKPLLIESGVVEDKTEDKFIGRQINDYLILERIGTGGMGAVYLAERLHSDFKQKVALKLIKRGMDSEAILRRFANERRILSGLKHPNIAQLLDGGISSDDLPFIVMEYVEGKPLNEFCYENNLSLDARLEIFRQICSAVEHAHKNLVIHRDLKPSNVIVTKDGIPKLLDFGIAKLLDNESETTAAQSRIFTPEYASPEQLNGCDITTVADVYSLGVLLYELLCGVRPFQTASKNYAEIANLVLTQEPVRPSSVISYAEHWPVVHETKKINRQITSDKELKTNPKSKLQDLRSLRGDLDNIILKAIRKEPARRYSSVQEFSEDIRRYLNGLPVSATADSARYRVSKFIKRHRQGVASTALVSLLILSLSGVSIYKGIAATRERDKANQRFEKLRDVAKLLMNETRDSLTKIPGTVQIQKSLAQKSVDLLDSIYDENTTDTQFLRELADSYDKLCWTQYWNFHEYEKAQKSAQRAIEIRRRVIQLQPDDVERKSELKYSLLSFSGILNSKGDTDGVIRLNSELLSIFRELAEKEPTEKRFCDLAFYLIGASHQFAEWKMSAESEAYQKDGDKILQDLIDSHLGRELTPQEKTDLAWELMWQAESFQRMNNDEKAFQNYQRAAALAESAYKADNSLQLAFNHTSRTHRSLGEIYEKRGQFQKAYEMYKFSFDWLKNSDLSNSIGKANLVYGIHFYANRCALMLTKLGRQRDADMMISEPFKDYSAFLDLEENAANLIYAQEPFLDLTKYFAETKRIKKAVEIWQQHFDRLQKFLDKNPDDIGFLHSQVTAQNEIGDIYSSYDEKSDSFKTTAPERLIFAMSHYKKAVELYRKSLLMYEPMQLERDYLKKLESKIARLS